MGDYFKPWRRKIGVLTLVMACVFMGAWVRSNSILDELLLHVAKNETNERTSLTYDILFSLKNSVVWKRNRLTVETADKDLLEPLVLPKGWRSSSKLPNFDRPVFFHEVRDHSATVAIVWFRDQRIRL